MAQDQRLIVSVSGIRGIIGEGLTPAAALAFASALGEATGGGRMVLSRDGRPSGLMLRHAVLAGLTAAGCDVEDLGVAPTATVGTAVKDLGAAGGIQITASHNAAPWNGLKLFGADGRVLSAAAGRKIAQLFEANQGRHVAWDKLGASRDYHQALDRHRDLVLRHIDEGRILRGRAAGLSGRQRRRWWAAGPDAARRVAGAGHRAGLRRRWALPP